MAFVPIIYAPGSQVESVNLTAMNAALADQNITEWTPTMVGIANGDIGTRRGWYSLSGELCHVHFQMTWNNTDGGTSGDDVEIDLPYEGVDYTAANTAPIVSYGLVDLPFSIWADSATDRAMQGYISHIGTAETMKLQRISSTNTSNGFMANGTAVSRQISCKISYPTTGVFLL